MVVAILSCAQLYTDPNISSVREKLNFEHVISIYCRSREVALRAQPNYPQPQLKIPLPNLFIFKASL